MAIINLLAKFTDGVLISLSLIFKNPPFWVKIFIGCLVGMATIRIIEAFINYLFTTNSYGLIPIKTKTDPFTATLQAWPAPLLNKGHKMFVSSWITLLNEPTQDTEIVQIGVTQPEIVITSDRNVKVRMITMDGKIHTLTSGINKKIPLKKPTFIALVINKNNKTLYIDNEIVDHKDSDSDIINIPEGATKVTYGSSFIKIGIIHNIYSGSGGMIERGVNEIKDKTEPSIDGCGNTL